MPVGLIAKRAQNYVARKIRYVSGRRNYAITVLPNNHPQVTCNSVTKLKRKANPISVCACCCGGEDEKRGDPTWKKKRCCYYCRVAPLNRILVKLRRATRRGNPLENSTHFFTDYFHYSTQSPKTWHREEGAAAVPSRPSPRPTFHTSCRRRPPVTYWAKMPSGPSSDRSSATWPAAPAPAEDWPAAAPAARTAPPRPVGPV